MNKLPLLLTSASIFLIAGCIEESPANQSNKNTQAERAEQVANSIVMTDNAEIDNIKNRIELTSKPGQLGYIILINESGQPILYEGVRGKVTSGGKRLTSPDRLITAGNGQGGRNMAVRQSPSDEGTWGSSNPYIFYWNTDGTYRQWSGHYLYSTEPMRLNIQPLVLNVKQ